MVPNAFCWSKMGAESGEMLAAIVRRKEYERQLGNGFFAWGIGNALGNAIVRLAGEVPEPQVLFSPMPSKAKPDDEAPAGVLLWRAFEPYRGAEMVPLPKHMLITSRASAGMNGKSRHYALFCRSTEPLQVPGTSTDIVVPSRLANLATGNALGSSQVTAVVRQDRRGAATGRGYPVAFHATLAAPQYARLAAPRLLTDGELEAMNKAAADGLDAWRFFVRQVRGAGQGGRPISSHAEYSE